ncbi:MULTISPECIES: MlaD family protein [Mycolicibacter]|uniref:MCE family protein n=1 Tax=Mycolicibacter kumamotonensis TaxID=354243 RepID=A0A7K3LCI9_9MYCO|nr:MULTISPECIES: MlaD family protein [Mycolicibacter]NDJ90079.1 MCE family protein [Mycolicibacter kumamotonensis]RAV01822.1 MCE family protein [Mycolicibacter senuensis]
MRGRDFLSFVVFGLMIAFAVGYIGALGVRVRPPSDRTNLSMTVADINGLVVDSNILLRGVPVGKVSKIASSVDGATVDFYVDGRFRIPADTEVRLENLSALGETYIGLVPRREDGPMLRDGQHIATESVIQPASITELAVSVGRVLSQADPDAVERILVEGDAALPDPNSVLPNLTHASELLRNTAADMHGHGRVLLSNFQTLLQNAGWVGPTLANTVPGIRGSALGAQRIMQEFSVGGLELRPEGMVTMGDLLRRIQKLLDDNGGDLKVIGEAIRPKMKGIAGALLTFDPSQILANIVGALPEDGAITLHVTIPEN